MSFRYKVLTVVAVAMVLCCADMCLAQPGGGRGGRGGGFFGGGNNMSGLIGQEEVQKEIGMVEDQINEYTERMAEYREELQDMFSGMRDAEDRRAFFEEMRGKMEEKTQEINDWVENDLLLPDQAKRLKQLVVQAGNRRGLQNNEALIEELGITDSQIEKMRAKAEEQEKLINEKLAKLRAQAQEEILAILDKDQQAKIKELMGETFAFPERQRGGFGGQRGGQQGGQGRGQRGGRPGGDGGGDRSDF